MTEQTAGSGRLRIHLLGGFRVTTDDGETIVDESWRRSKARSLIKLLAIKPEHSLHRDMLIETLWPERDPKSGANNLHKNVHYVRRAVQNGLPATR